MMNNIDFSTWDRWICRPGFSDRDPDGLIMLIRCLWKGYGCHVDLHRMVGTDAPGCFHTHPAHALRIVIHGGYEEELLIGGESFLAERPVGYVGAVHPDLTHRVHRLLGDYSESIWLRGPVTSLIHLVGWGWPDDLRNKAVTVGDEDGQRHTRKT